MKTKQLLIMNLAALMAVVMVTTVWAQEKRTKVPAFLTTPDKVESRIGSLQFNDGYPTGEAAAKIRDELDYLHGAEAFMNSIQGVSTYALRKGLMDIGVMENEFILPFFGWLL